MSEHRFVLRLPEVLWLELQRSAQGARRSVNSEIVWRLLGGSVGVVPATVVFGNVPDGRREMVEADLPVGDPGVVGDLRVRMGAVPFESAVPCPPQPSVPDGSFRPDFGKRLKP